MSIGFCTDLDVDLSLVTTDSETCIMCSNQAVKEGLLAIACQCRHTLCLAHYTSELPVWGPGMSICCYFHLTKKTCPNSEPGTFLGWASVR